MDKRKTIFPVSYYHGKVENNDRLKGQLLPHINSKKDRLFVPEGWTTTKIITSHDDDRVNDFLFDCKELKEQYIDVIESFCDDKYIIEIDEIWFNYYIDGEYQEQISLIRSHSFEFASHKHDEGHKPDISECDMIMFPSYLEHEVKAGRPTPDNPRITISFNLNLFWMGE